MNKKKTMIDDFSITVVRVLGNLYFFLFTHFLIIYFLILYSLKLEKNVIV